MDSTLVNVFIALIVGIPVGILVLWYFFKNSILFKIGAFWVSNLLIIMVNSVLSTKFREVYPVYFSLPVGIAITVYFLYLTNKIIKGPLANALNNLYSLSHGNLDIDVRKVTEERKDELALIENSVFDLSENLKKVISKVKESTNHLNDSSQHLSSSSQQLSQGSSEQASTTEEISSTVEQLHANIKQNNENSVGSIEIAQTATIDLDQLLRISEKNHKSVDEIAEKIKIINDIAFQTNILALNAAVEASRAGESGKGFAVVASEVRKLAEKSKSAADSINSLSNASIEINNQTNELLKKLVPEIDKTVGFMKEISSATNQQSAGVEQLSNAIQQLNQVTQQNAASAEELAANSIELNQDASELAKSIEYFKFKNSFGKAKKEVYVMSQPEKKTKISEPLKNEPIKSESVFQKRNLDSKGAFIDLKNIDSDDEFERF